MKKPKNEVLILIALTITVLTVVGTLTMIGHEPPGLVLQVQNQLNEPVVFSLLHVKTKETLWSVNIEPTTMVVVDLSDLGNHVEIAKPQDIFHGPYKLVGRTSGQTIVRENLFPGQQPKYDRGMMTIMLTSRDIVGLWVSDEQKLVRPVAIDETRSHPTSKGSEKREVLSTQD